MDAVRSQRPAVGITYCAAVDDLVRQPGVVDVVEIEPQTMWRAAPGGAILIDDEALDRVASLSCPCVLHGVAYPVGGTVAPDRAALTALRHVADRLAPAWVSEHLAFNQVAGDGGGAGFFTGFFLPPRQTLAGARAAADAIRAMADALGRPVAVETGVNYWPPRRDELPDGAWIAEVVERADCGLVLDLHNAWTNQRNGRQAVAALVRQLPLERVWEVHLAGGEERHGLWIDGHCAGLPTALAAVARAVVPRLPALRAMIFETFPAHLPRLGPEFLPEQVARLRALAALPPRAAEPRERFAVAEALATTHDAEPDADAAADAGPSPEVWEASVGRLVVGRAPRTELEVELATGPALLLIRELVAEARLSTLVSALPLTTFLIMRHAGPGRLVELGGAYGAVWPPERYGAAEALRFAAWLAPRAAATGVPYLADVLGYETAVVETLLDGHGRVVGLTHDPLPLLRALADRRWPEGVRAGRYEVEITP